MAEGWIKLHRQALDTPELQTAVRRGIWDWLLLKAAHKPAAVVFRGKPARIDRGQIAVSVHAMAKEQDIGHKALRNILDSFVESGMVRMDKAQGKAFTLITISNFSHFQGIDERDGQSERQSEGKVGAKSGQREQEGKKDRRESPTSSESLFGNSLDSVPRPNGRRSVGDWFEEFWECWDIPGTKEGRKAALVKFTDEVKKGTDPAVLCDGVRRLMVWARRYRYPVRFIKAPAVWLHQGCWTDDLNYDPNETRGNGQRAPAKPHKRDVRDSNDELTNVGQDDPK